MSLELGQCQPIGGEGREATNDKRLLRVTLPTRLQFGARTRARRAVLRDAAELRGPRDSTARARVTCPRGARVPLESGTFSVGKGHRALGWGVCICEVELEEQPTAM